ncbi:Uncharacterised protein [Salmonella enterica subsp. enterica serovar Typhimurium]|nr:Uncharacterised protein [Salmonella enterica subsp. enterica serovar Typhimurium]
MGLRLDDEQDITATSFTVMAILIPLTFKARLMAVLNRDRDMFSAEADCVMLISLR